MNGPTPDKVMQLITGRGRRAFLARGRGTVCSQLSKDTRIMQMASRRKPGSRRAGAPRRSDWSRCADVIGRQIRTAKRRPSSVGANRVTWALAKYSWKTLHLAKLRTPPNRHAECCANGGRADNPFWHARDRDCAAFVSIAQMAAERLGSPQPGVSWLDVGGQASGRRRGLGGQAGSGYQRIGRT